MVMTIKNRNGTKRRVSGKLFIYKKVERFYCSKLNTLWFSPVPPEAYGQVKKLWSLGASHIHISGSNGRRVKAIKQPFKGKRSVAKKKTIIK